MTSLLSFTELPIYVREKEEIINYKKKNGKYFFVGKIQRKMQTRRRDLTWVGEAGKGMMKGFLEE